MQLHCTIRTSNFSSYDLSPLMAHDHDYKLNIPQDGRGRHVEYSINVCRPLAGEDGCDSKSAVCMKEWEKDAGKYDEAVRLQRGMQLSSFEFLHLDNSIAAIDKLRTCVEPNFGQEYGQRGPVQRGRQCLRGGPLQKLHVGNQLSMRPRGGAGATRVR